jgi:hypothetical protein
MVEKTDVLDALHTDLKTCLARYTGDVDSVLNEVWPHVIEALDFAEFVARPHTGQGAVVEDPYAHLSPEEIETLIKKGQPSTDPTVDESLARSQGKWARDE